MRLQHIRRSADRCGAAITMLCDLISAGGNDESRASGDVKGILSIASCAHNVQRIVVIEIDALTSFEQSITETEQFIHRNATRLHTH